MLVARELSGLRLRDQLLGPWRAVVSVAIMAVAIVPFEGAVANASDLIRLALDLAIVGGIGTAVYVSSMFLLWRLVGCPDGLEFHVAKLLASLVRRVRSISAE